MWRGQHGRLMFPRFTMTGGVWRVAEKLRINQENVSRLEQRTDLLISTLSSYVEAMGGKLSLAAEFPFHRGAHHGVARIICKLLVQRKLSNQQGGSMNVVQKPLGLKLHRQVILSALSIAGSMGS